MAKPGKSGIERVIDAFGYSMKGIAAAWRSEAAFRQEAALALILLPAAFFVARDLVDWVLLTSSVLLVLIVELLNSAIEAVVDRIGSELHVLSGQAKDMGSAAVFFSLWICGLTWVSIIYLHFFAA